MERNLEKYLCTCCHTSQTKTHCKSTIVQFFFQSCSYHVPQSHVTRSTHPLWGTLPPNISLFMRIHQANTNWETIPKHLKMTIPKCQGHTRSGKTEKLSQLGRDSWRKRRREGRKRGEKWGRKMRRTFPPSGRHEGVWAQFLFLLHLCYFLDMQQESRIACFPCSPPSS